MNVTTFLSNSLEQRILLCKHNDGVSCFVLKSPLRKEFMPKFIDEVLSEIVGVPCGDITFSLCVESVGQTLGGLLC